MDDRSHRLTRWVVPTGFVVWVTGLALWEWSLPAGLVVSVAGGAALVVGLDRLARRPHGLAPTWRVPLLVGVSLILISQGVGQSDYRTRVALVGLGVLALVIVFVLVLDERGAVERQLAQRTLAEERRRLAGDVHGVVGHTLSASMLHMSAARLAVRSDPDAAVSSLVRAEEHGRRSMDDIRSVVRLLGDDESAGGGPSLQLSALPSLVDDFRAAGATIGYSTSGDLDDLPATVGLTVHRVLQEGLTNAVRHGVGPIDVDLARDPDSVRVVVANGRRAVGVPAPAGSGRRGMRERVEAVGGTLDVDAGAGTSTWCLRVRTPT